MELVYLFIGLGIGILVGALVQDRVRRDEAPKVSSDLASLLKEAASSVDKDEAVSITVTAVREDCGGSDDGHPDFPFLCNEMMKNWRNN